MDDSKGCHLSVVIDLSPTQWHMSAEASPANTYPLPLNTFLAQLLAFLNAHIASKHENTLAVFGAFPGKRSAAMEDYKEAQLTNSTIVTRIMEELEELREPAEEASNSLVSAITKALCYVNRVNLPTPSPSSKPGQGLDTSILPDPRILVLSVSPDLSTSGVMVEFIVYFLAESIE
ncbi:hypothetical protein DXG03_003208 [Asterophora parasitica]|uniref:General transcription and DNA repair factor IIH subunit TFB4 n=1 Tax=Asterophora parasitica TaxID=117018 RepID=A0A9P7GKD5_9AGAR|nr:hypothetical protein DXG03_003208 [Asterophora parasitica]